MKSNAEVTGLLIQIPPDATIYNRCYNGNDSAIISDTMVLTGLKKGHLVHVYPDANHHSRGRFRADQALIPSRTPDGRPVPAMILVLGPLPVGTTVGDFLLVSDVEDQGS